MPIMAALLHIHCRCYHTMTAAAASAAGDCLLLLLKSKLL